MKVNIYYGGRGLLDDPTLYVLNKMEEVLRELRVTVERINIYEHKNEIATLPQTMKEADGIILATTIEWLGIGGYMQQFLDACWLYGDKEKIQTTYMQPIVMSTTYGEREGEMTLANAWEILGGIPCEGICTYVADHTDFETNPDYALLIEKKAESFYRSFSKKLKVFPSSTNSICENTLRPKTMQLTPQESEQLSMYVSDNNYVQKQKEDIEELTSMFKGLLGDTDEEETAAPISGDPLADALQEHFRPVSPLTVCYNLQFEDGRVLSVDIHDEELICSNKANPAANVQIRLDDKTVRRIVQGELTMHNAFLSGAVTAKGDFKQIRTFDTLFPIAIS